jgi:transglutaminase-like putative cysteine protease
MKKLKVQKLIAGALIVSAMSAAPAFADDSSSSTGIAGFFHSLSTAISNFFHSIGSNSSSSSSSSSASSTPTSSSTSTVTPADELAQESRLVATSPAPIPQSIPSTRVSSTSFSSDSAAAAGSQSTQNSEIAMSGEAPRNTRWLMVQIIKSGESGFTETAPYSAGEPLPTVYLSQGAGSYTINLFSLQDASYLDVTGAQFISQTQIANQDQRDELFSLPALDIQSNNAQVQALAEKLTRSQSSDREKALAVHNWMTENIAYDVDGVNDNTFTQKPQDAISVMNSKMAVCLGYSSLYAALMRSVGIHTKVVIGKLIGADQENQSNEQICQANTADHAWNEVYVGNRWVTVDTTLDAGSDNINGDTGVASFKRTPNNTELFDPSPSLFSMSHLKCYEEQE